ncbi:MAG: NAD(P)-binding domain-containing protein, partial [Burkholderiaceae bacterium]
MTKGGLNIGFIGLGIMGSPMAQNLQKAGHQLFIYSRSKVADELVQGGATVCVSSADVAKRGDIIITMLPDTPQVDEVLFGDKGVAAGLSAGKVVVDMSSIAPFATKA